MNRRGTPPPPAGEGAGDDDGARGPASVPARVSDKVLRVLQTMLQHAASKSSVIDMLDLSGAIKHDGSLNLKSNPGVVIEALLDFAGLKSTEDGKRLWRADAPDVALEWQTSDSRASLRPASRVASTRDEVRATAGLEHDGNTTKVVGSKAQRRGAEAAKLVAPRALGLTQPNAALAAPITHGSGWGNAARPLTSRCLAEQAALDTLVAVVQDHRARCSRPLRRVDGGGCACWGSHAMGLINVCTYVCDADVPERCETRDRMYIQYSVRSTAYSE